jgi:acyl carrier protein
VANATHETEERVHRIFREALHVEIPGSDVDLFESGALDSLAFVDLLVALADELGREIAIDRLEISDFRTVAAIAAFLDGYATEAAS